MKCFVGEVGLASRVIGVTAGEFGQTVLRVVIFKN